MYNSRKITGNSCAEDADFRVVWLPPDQSTTRRLTAVGAQAPADRELGEDSSRAGIRLDGVFDSARSLVDSLGREPRARAENGAAPAGRTRKPGEAGRHPRGAESHRTAQETRDVKEQTQTATAMTATGATRAASADELDPGRERRPLESYFQEIGGT